MGGETLATGSQQAVGKRDEDKAVAGLKENVCPPLNEKKRKAKCLSSKEPFLHCMGETVALIF